MSSLLLLLIACLAMAAALLVTAQLIAYLVAGAFDPWWTSGAIALFGGCIYLLYADLWRARGRG